MKRLVCSISLAVLVAVGAPTGAQALSELSSHLGYNYSFNNRYAELYAYDGESDGYVAEAQAWGSGGRTVVRDTTEGDGWAGSKKCVNMYKHRIIEDHLYDQVGPWVYP